MPGVTSLYVNDVPVKLPASSRCQPLTMSHHTQSWYLTAPDTGTQLSSTSFTPACAVSAGFESSKPFPAVVAVRVGVTVAVAVCVEVDAASAEGVAVGVAVNAADCVAVALTFSDQSPGTPPAGIARTAYQYITPVVTSRCVKEDPVKAPSSRRCHPVALFCQTHSSYLRAPATGAQLRFYCVCARLRRQHRRRKRRGGRR